MDRKIFWLLVISLITRVFYLFFEHAIWWDAAVYLSMGKYLFTSGALGFWEPIRPLLWPFLLGYGHYFGINQVILGHILSTFFSLGVIYMTYVVGSKVFNKNVGFLSAALISFTWIFFFFNVRLYTEIPSVFFALVAVYYFLKGKYIETGLFCGLAFLTKFPQGIIFVILIVATSTYLNRAFSVFVGFGMITLPYFIFNQILYGSPFAILLFASEFVKHAGIWIFQEPWYYYLLSVVQHNILFLLVIPGIFFAIKKKKYLIIVLSMVFLLYFSITAHKELRFAIVFLPYLAILASYGYTKLFKNKGLFFLILLIFFVAQFEVISVETNPYFSFFDGKEVNGEVLITHPLSGYYVGSDATLMYFPWFNKELGDHWLNHITKNKPEYVSIDTCEGGFICNPNELECENKRNEIIDLLETNYETIYSGGSGRCRYLIFRRSIQ
jgi:hypothetical protein